MPMTSGATAVWGKRIAAASATAADTFTATT
jgi:hypothetical protein